MTTLHSLRHLLWAVAVGFICAGIAVAEDYKDFRSLSLDEMKLYHRLARAMQGSYAVQDHGRPLMAEGITYFDGSYESDALGYDASVWKVQNPNGPDKTMVCAIFNGTHGVTDILTDVHTGILGLLSTMAPITVAPASTSVHQLDKAAQEINGLLTRYNPKGEHISYILGHSLGGGMAQNAYLALTSKHRNTHMVVINPMGLPSIVRGINNAGRNLNVTIIINGFEPLQYANAIANLKNIKGQFYKIPSFDLLGMLNQHSLDHAVSRMELFMAEREMQNTAVSSGGSGVYENDPVEFLAESVSPYYEQVTQELRGIKDRTGAMAAVKSLERLQKQGADMHAWVRSGKMSKAGKKEYGEAIISKASECLLQEVAIIALIKNIEQAGYYQSADLKNVLKQLEATTQGILIKQN